MSWTKVYKCDRCGDISQHGTGPEYRNPDLLPEGWGRIIAHYDIWDTTPKDLCKVCADMYGVFIRNE